MKNTFRLLALSALVLTVLGFSAFGVMALTPISSPEVSTAVATLEPRNEVVGVVSAIDANTVTVDGTVYDLNSFTETKSTIQVGDTVRLELTTNPDGSLTVNQIVKPDPTSDPGMHATGTEPVSPDQGSSNNSKGSTMGNNNGQGPDNGSNLNNNNGSSQGNGNGSSQDSNNGSVHDSGSGSGITAGNGGN